MVHVVEFDVIRKEDAATADALTLKSQAVYELLLESEDRSVE